MTRSQTYDWRFDSSLLIFESLRCVIFRRHRVEGARCAITQTGLQTHQDRDRSRRRGSHRSACAEAPICAHRASCLDHFDEGQPSERMGVRARADLGLPAQRHLGHRRLQRTLRFRNALGATRRAPGQRARDAIRPALHDGHALSRRTNSYPVSTIRRRTAFPAKRARIILPACCPMK